LTRKLSFWTIFADLNSQIKSPQITRAACIQQSASDIST
jgi:hypothetical protein